MEILFKAYGVGNKGIGLDGGRVNGIRSLIPVDYEDS